MHRALRTSPDTYRRDWKTGLTCFARWIANPVSAEGSAALARAGLALSGPDTAAMVDRLRADPAGQRLMRDRPSLGAALSDMPALAAMPPGSFGRAYHDFMDRPEVIPTAVLAAGLYHGGHIDRIGWSDDMIYLTDRMAHTHDLTHVLSAYGTSLPAEAINIGFVIGIEGRPAGRALAEMFAAFTTSIFWPKVGARSWRALLIAAFERGAAAARVQPWFMIPFEQLLCCPLDDVRRQLGIPELADPVVAPESWLRNPIGKAMAHGYGKAAGAGSSPEVKTARQLALAGVSARQLAELGPERFASMVDAFSSGASTDELLADIA